MQSYLKLRTFLVIAVIAIFAWASHPLSPLDFYETFRNSLRPEARESAELLIKRAKQAQELSPDLYPSSALLKSAEACKMELSELTELPGVKENADVISSLRKRAASSIRLGLDLNGGVEFILNLEPDYETLRSGGVSYEEAKQKLEENFQTYRDLAMEALRKRLEARNIFEAEIAPFAARGLSLKAPLVSADEKDQLQQLLKTSSKLEFRLVHPRSREIISTHAPLPVGYELLQEVGTRSREGRSNSYVVQRRPEMTGSGIDKAFVLQSEYGAIGIALRFNHSGAVRFAEVTGKNVHRELAIVLDGRLYCAPVIQGAISGGQAEITGHFSREEAQMIADALTSGSFPFKIKIDAVFDTAPTLGMDNVQNGIKAGITALIVLGIFMIVYYRWAGVIAVLALSANVVLILGFMATFGATLTMPGIAGIILTLGMAVDANVLVFERMREERVAGHSAEVIVENGFSRAFSAVIDGNLTTLLVALILVWLGSGAVKGFAVSLAIGIVSSLFTALFMSKVCFDWLLKFRKDTHFSMLCMLSNPKIPFLRQSRIALRVSGILMAATVLLCAVKGRDMLSVDFTGGTLLNYHYQHAIPVDDLEKVLNENGLSGRITLKSSASQTDDRQLEILFREGTLERLNKAQTDYPDVVAGLLNAKYPNLALTNGSSTVIGGMVGAEMTKTAVISLVLALLGMILYVSLRYEFSYAAAGILALVHDVIISLGIYLATGREMSLSVVAGLLTIIGYSINDTIVIFDRIREEQKLQPERAFTELVDLSLNLTLSRTLLTSITTFLVVVVMLIMGGIAIADFMLVIALGIIIGSYSSLYIASPLMVYFRNVNLRRKKSA